MKHFIYSLCLALLFCSASNVRGQEPLASTAPIRIEADRMETSQEKNVVQFSGHVRANQGELVINADTMTVHYAGTEDRTGHQADGAAGDLTRQIAKITARGNVEIVQEGWVAAGDAMDFNADERIVVLSGNARAWQNQNMVSGEKIILYLNEGRSVVEKSSAQGDRVKAFIYPGSKETRDGAQPSGER